MTTPHRGSSRIDADHSDGNHADLRDADGFRPDRDVRTDTPITVAPHTHAVPAPPQPQITVPTPRRDQIRWGAVWAGVVVALATFLLLEVAFLALGWLTPGSDAAGVGRAVVTGLIGLGAFFLGGLTAGATAMWDGVRSGILHGIMVWAVGFTAILAFALVGGGALLGPVADVLNQVTFLVQAPAGADLTAVTDTAQGAAADAALGLGLAIAAAVLGGLMGTKMWGGREHSEASTTRR